MTYSIRASESKKRKMGPGSIKEEELIQMVRDYIESSESQTPISDKSSNIHHPLHLSLQEILGKQTRDEVEIHEKISTYIKSKGSSVDQSNNNNNNNLKKMIMMKLKMDGYEASLCTTSSVSTFRTYLQVLNFTGDYEYIDVMMMEREENNMQQQPQTRLIIDVDFRSQFELARPTTTYKQLINNLPLIFVGCEEKLNKTISIVCSAAKQSLEEKGLDLPPWRKLSYMQSKWFSKNCKKVSISPTNIDFGMETCGGHKGNESSSSSCCFHF